MIFFGLKFFWNDFFRKKFSVYRKTESSVISEWERWWKNKEIECIKEKIEKNKIKCYEMSEKISDGFHLERGRHPDVCLKAAMWLRAKQNAVSDMWVKMELGRSKCRDLERYKTFLPKNSDLWQSLDTLSKRRLESWVDVVNETTENILRLRYQRSFCHYDYKEESRRKHDALRSVCENIERNLKINRAREKHIEKGFFSFERFPLAYLQAKMWWQVQMKLVRSKWNEIMVEELKEDADYYSFSINKEGNVWKSLDSLSKDYINAWVESVNIITFRLLDCRLYKDSATTGERIYSWFCRPGNESRNYSSRLTLPSSLLWDD